MLRFQKLTIKYQLFLFFLLVYPLSWWSLPVARGLLPHGVVIAAVIVIALSAGKPGLKAYWKHLTNFRVSWLLMVAPAIIVIFKFFDIVSNLIAGADFIGFAQVSFVAIAIELLLLGGLWEELGWSGYALPKLQKRFAKSKHGIIIATFILGIFRGIWHIPLFIVGAIPLSDVIWFSPFVFQPFITWLYNRSKGSVLVVLIFHYFSNLIFAVSPSFAGGDKTFYTVLFMCFGGLATFALLWKTQFRLGFDKDYK